MTTATLDSSKPFAPYREIGNDELCQRISQAKKTLGKSLLILGHHYQQDEVIEHADLTGDSYQLSKLAAESPDCRTIVFCGVHFMAETADILANRPEKLKQRDNHRVAVVLPDMAAGCSMADMAAIRQVESAWEQLSEVIDTKELTPVTYINSAASLKAFCGKHGGIVCTSSNAKAVLDWSFAQRKRVIFFPRPTPRSKHFAQDGDHQRPNARLESSRGRTRWELTPSDRGIESHFVEGPLLGPPDVPSGPRPSVSRKTPRHQGFGSPQCPQEVNDIADISGSTSKIIETVQKAPAGTKWAIGTELHLVNRLKKQHPEQEIYFLSPLVCMCATMYRIDLAHLCWSLENIVQGTIVNQIHVKEDVARWSLIALERMLTVK